MNELTWVEISRGALSENLRNFRRLVGDEVLISPCVKANAYGHGLVEAARIFVEAGADWLAVDALYEAEKLRAGGLEVPIYIMGYTLVDDLARVVELDCRQIVYSKEMVERLGELGTPERPVKVHLKLETGNNRQGVLLEELVEFAWYVGEFKGLELEGLCTHFANIEDTTDHSYALGQLERFREGVRLLEEAGIEVPVRHCANSAATLLFEETRFEMVRTGIANYGMWPSNETYLSFLREKGGDFELEPGFCWKTRVAQVKTIAAGEYIGYGCTYRTTHETKLAILPVGYYDGYDRGISNKGYVLIRGQRAPVRGRVCMNIMMVEVTDIDGVELEDEVVLMGRQGDEEIGAELFASWADTINYEVTTRVNERIPRVVVA